MSIIKAIRSQLGLSVTPANNFTLDASADNGTMKLARGNAGATTQDIFTVDAAGVLTASQGIVTNRLVLSTVRTPSGTFIDFSDVPSWAKIFTVGFSGLSTNGSSNIQVQLGVLGAPETSGYVGSAESTGTVSSYSSGMLITRATSAASSVSGLLRVSLIDPTSRTWACSGTAGAIGGGYGGSTGGHKLMPGAVNLIRVTTVNGTDTFDSSGIISVLYEG